MAHGGIPMRPTRPRSFPSSGLPMRPTRTRIFPFSGLEAERWRKYDHFDNDGTLRGLG